MRTFQSVLRQLKVDNYANQVLQRDIQIYNENSQQKHPKLKEIMNFFMEFPDEDYILNFCRNQQLLESNKKCQKYFDSDVKQQGVDDIRTVQKKNVNKNGARYIFKTQVGKKLSSASKRPPHKQNSQFRQADSKEQQISDISFKNKQNMSGLQKNYNKAIQVRNQHIKQNKACSSKKMNQQDKKQPKLQNQKCAQNIKQKIHQANQQIAQKINGIAYRIVQAKAQIAQYLQKYDNLAKFQQNKVTFDGISEVTSEKYDSKVIDGKIDDSKEQNDSITYPQIVLQKCQQTYHKQNDSSVIKIIENFKKENSPSYEAIQITGSQNFTFDFDVDLEKSN